MGWHGMAWDGLAKKARLLFESISQRGALE